MVVSIVHVTKAAWLQISVLDGRRCERITAYLARGRPDNSPAPLGGTTREAFNGTKILRSGILASTTRQRVQRLRLDREPAYRETTHELGHDLAIHRRRGGQHRIPAMHRTDTSYIFGDLPRARRGKWPELCAIVREKVKPRAMRPETTPNGRDIKSSGGNS